jgi:glycosyltransferase involved in cell wall biosynthesis
MQDPWSDVETTEAWLDELCDRHRPDVLHMNTFSPVSRRDLTVLLTVHSCVLTWWRAVHGVDAPPEWKRYRALARRALRRANLLTAPTRALLDDLRAAYGPLPPAAVVPNGLDVGATPPAPSKQERLVVSLGRLWDEAKNAGLLVNAAANIDGDVVMIGPGRAGEPAHQRQATWLGSLERVEALAWLAQAAVFAEPARYEPFGLSALEAAQCGCALVLGDIPSLREVWGPAATYVSPDEPDALAAAINGLLADRDHRRAAARAARIRARRYAPATMAGAYLAAYRQLSGMAVAA